MRNDPARQAEHESLVLRLIWTILFAIGWQLAELLLMLVVLIQFLHRVFKGVLHRGLLEFGDSLAQFLGQTARYLTFASDDKPWPFASWPASRVETDDPVDRVT